jgi:hypothetical protein
MSRTRKSALLTFGAAIGVYTIFDKLDLIPEDPDKIITLSLTEVPPANGSTVVVASRWRGRGSYQGIGV